jgi:hypothetical protein
MKIYAKSSRMHLPTTNTLIHICIILTILEIAILTDYSKKSKIDVEFQEYVLEFESVFNVSVGSIPITFADLKENNIGECHLPYFKKSNAAIYIDKEYWVGYSSIERKALIFHELGHCIFNLDHVNLVNITDNFCPVSLMYESIQSVSCLTENWDKYITNFKREISNATK